MKGREIEDEKLGFINGFGRRDRVDEEEEEVGKDDFVVFIYIHTEKRIQQKKCLFNLLSALFSGWGFLSVTVIFQVGDFFLFYLSLVPDLY